MRASMGKKSHRRGEGMGTKANMKSGTAACRVHNDFHPAWTLSQKGRGQLVQQGRSRERPVGQIGKIVRTLRISRGERRRTRVAAWVYRSAGSPGLREEGLAGKPPSIRPKGAEPRTTQGRGSELTLKSLSVAVLYPNHAHSATKLTKLTRRICHREKGMSIKDLVVPFATL